MLRRRPSRERADPLTTYLRYGGRRTAGDPAPPAPAPEPDTSMPQWDRLTGDELELLQVLLEKAYGHTDGIERLHLTIGPDEWVRRAPDSAQLYRRKTIVLESVPTS